MGMRTSSTQVPGKLRPLLSHLSPSLDHKLSSRIRALLNFSSSSHGASKPSALKDLRLLCHLSVHLGYEEACSEKWNDRSGLHYSSWGPEQIWPALQVNRYFGWVLPTSVTQNCILGEIQSVFNWLEFCPTKREKKKFILGATRYLKTDSSFPCASLSLLLLDFRDSTILNSDLFSQPFLLPCHI